MSIQLATNPNRRPLSPCILITNSSKFNLAPDPPRAFASRSTWLSLLHRASVFGDGGSGGEGGLGCVLVSSREDEEDGDGGEKGETEEWERSTSPAVEVSCCRRGDEEAD
ncbi:hypothetical protein HCDG_02532 [Histoplasma capsulatum H143]|uniref:Uncharacterized protein n=1 Tax=Ajellomyces capsulatus (strain H143) TaxID=544712 RepID=C6H8K1_AJECH|nr:hypothetical protein HCDG_02532 [Histoplasma capsulatum H143]